MAITDVDVFAHLTDADIESLGVELDAIRQDIEDSRGERDSRYIRRTIAGQRALEVVGRLLPVDMYAGGREHTTRHHLYSRFLTRALHDLGHLPFDEPFGTLRLHGLVIKDGAKMSKSRGNVVNPDDYIARVGADNLRLYLLFCGEAALTGPVQGTSPLR